MERLTKKKASNTDYTKPISIMDINIPSDDCFSRLYDASERFCALCADRINCQNLMAQRNLAKQRLDLEIQNNYFLDQSRELDLTDLSKFKEYFTTNTKVKKATFLDYLKTLCKCSESDYLHFQLQRLSTVLPIQITESEIIYEQ